jgi:hypothetical protein
VKRKHPLLRNRMQTMDSVRRKLGGYVRNRDDKCVPLTSLVGKKVIYPEDCEARLTVSIPRQETTQSTTTFTVEFEILDANNNIVWTTSNSIEVVMHVPIVVSIGDSYASGEGNPDKNGKADGGVIATGLLRDCENNTTLMIARGTTPNMNKQPVWLNEKYHRSLISPPAVAAKELLKDWTFVIFLAFARSGAKIIASDGPNVVGLQIDEIKSLFRGKKIDVLLVSAGGNDVGFADVLTGFGSDFLQNTSDHTRRLFETRLQGLRNNGYVQLDRQIKDLNVGKVLISEYSGHLFCNDNGVPMGGCGVFVTLQQFRISRRNAARMDSMCTALNKEVKRAAESNGWHYVSGISEKFAKHGYCSSDPYYVSAENSCKNQGNFDGTMHPNAKGVRVYGTVIGTKLRQLMPVRRMQEVAHARAE